MECRSIQTDVGLSEGHLRFNFHGFIGECSDKYDEGIDSWIGDKFLQKNWRLDFGAKWHTSGFADS
jgi:hypothetical protein